MDRKNNTKQFLYKKSYLERRLQHDIMENGIAYIPCNVKGIEDIISKFSVKGCESLDAEFMDFIIEYIDFIPSEYPVVLEISGAEFNAEEKKMITDTIAGDMDYLLGKNEEDLLHKRRRFFGMMVGTFLSGIALGFAKRCIADVPLEFFYVIFWLFADAFIRYLFIEKLDFRDEKIRVGRLASMKVEFVDPVHLAETP